VIYLIDDNQNNQREHLGISFVEEGVFKDCLVSIEKLEKRASANDMSHLEFLKDARCILLHASTEDYDSEKDTFLSGSHTNVRKVKEDIADFGDKIPLVLFSNGTTETVYSPDKNPNFISGMNKNTFYTNLRDFVEYYKNTGGIEFRILVWGKNFRTKEVSGLASILLETIAFQNETDIFEIAQLSDKQHVFKSFMEMSLPAANFADVLNDLEKNPISICEFRNKINLIIESFLEHGKNIYPWK
jgi:hypothetical protein